ncbi:MAG TPA: hypothetical protein PLW88_00245 [Syntrophorhabdaceae bacterium]|mgnify:FL=1|nr:hypothetical protein [Syntrophorhabdaceae bacterium]HPP05769.1 hypothetical protein [Syntrophorhabdaceae bacterium]
MKKRKEEHQRLLEEFKALTLAALEKTDTDGFIETLIKRDGLIKKIINENIELDTGEVDFLFGLEERVIERLEAERKNVIEGMGEIGEKKRAIKRYTPKFPFPPMPAFFEKKG